MFQVTFGSETIGSETYKCLYIQKNCHASGLILMQFSRIVSPDPKLSGWKFHRYALSNTSQKHSSPGIFLMHASY